MLEHAWSGSHCLSSGKMIYVVLDTHSIAFGEFVMARMLAGGTAPPAADKTNKSHMAAVVASLIGDFADGRVVSLSTSAARIKVERIPNYRAESTFWLSFLSHGMLTVTTNEKVISAKRVLSEDELDCFLKTLLNIDGALGAVVLLAQHQNQAKKNFTIWF